MNVQRWLVIHSAVLVLAGLMFLLYSPLVIAWLGLSQFIQDSQGYWAMVSFARMFGVALVAWGATLLISPQAWQKSELVARLLRKLLLTVMVGDFLAAFSAAIQAASVWGIASSWLISLGFGILGVISLVFLLVSGRESVG
ncbi:MAG: hypothetical protein Kow0088_02210 [Anaerolineales bacterium]